ncbi:GGDEF domain-containing protein [Planomicrobium sp. YIM 101495]|uniref:GGDEF domain-containing protein n=1 Tax=Planomicrobium sp. YIM 101495 TaxID=2665160 RepID=UPI0018A966EC|nr:GGDEF domain-containing protein [Planomicrobium sp. YIM 101495]
MNRQNVMMMLLFLIATSIAVFSQRPDIPIMHFLMTVAVFVFFSVIYSQLRLKIKYGDTELDYAINYGIAIALFAGPLGAVIYEIFYNVSVHLINKWRKPDYRKPFLYVFYNISIFSFANIFCFYLYGLLSPLVEDIPFGFWLLFAILVFITNLLTDTFILIHFIFIKKINSFREALNFYDNWNGLDLGKTALINGFLFIFLIEGSWDLLIGVFLLNYFVSQSIFPILQNLKDKDDRDKFMKMAYRDALTGANNRAFMDLKMRELSDSGETFGIVVADIDRFKTVNDSYNHAVGDEVLKHFAAFLKSYLREGDLLFRSGGEEFTLFFRNSTFEEIQERLENLRSNLADSVTTADFNDEPVEISYTASFGLYYKKFEDHPSIEKGYIFADNLLFESKRAGRNRITAENGL